MQYRRLGRTELQVSALGLGGHEYARILNPYHFPEGRAPEERIPLELLQHTQAPRNRVVAAAIAAGINFFDTGVIEECQSLGLALQHLGCRANIYIAAEMMGPVRRLTTVPRHQWRDVLLDGLDERLETLQTPYIDLFHIHEIQDGYVRRQFEAVIACLQDAQQQGHIRFLGAADHSPRFLAELVRKYDCFDAVMIPYNFHRPTAARTLFPVCRALDVGVIVMKPFCWPYYGIPIQHFAGDVGISTPSSVTQSCLNWILHAPEVSTIVPGTNTLHELQENLQVLRARGNGAFDLGLLQRCLDVATSHRGRITLRTLCQDPDIARTRAHIRGYAARALDGWIEH